MGAAESKPLPATLGEAHAAQRRKSSATSEANAPTNQSVNQPGMIAVGTGVTVYDRAPQIRHQSSINQPIDQTGHAHAHGPVDQTISQHVNHPVQPVDQSINQPAVVNQNMATAPVQQAPPVQTVNQPINQPIQQTHQPATQPITQTVIPGQTAVVKSLESIPVVYKLDNQSLNQPMPQQTNIHVNNQVNAIPVDQSSNQSNKRTIETQTEQIDENDRSVRVLTPTQATQQSVNQQNIQTTNASPEKVVFHADPGLSISQPTTQTANQTVNQPTSPMSPITPQSGNQSTVKLNHQLNQLKINQSISQSDSVWIELIKWAAPLLPHGALNSESASQSSQSPTEKTNQTISAAMQQQVAEAILLISQSPEFTQRLSTKQMERKIRRKNALEEQKRLAALGIKQPVNQSNDQSLNQSENQIGPADSPIKLAIPYDIAAKLLSIDQSMDQSISQMRLKWVPSRVSEETFFTLFFDQAVKEMHQLFDHSIKNSTGKQGLTVAQQVAALEAAKKA